MARQSGRLRGQEADAAEGQNVNCNDPVSVLGFVPGFYGRIVHD